MSDTPLSSPPASDLAAARERLSRWLCEPLPHGISREELQRRNDVNRLLGDGDDSARLDAILHHGLVDDWNGCSIGDRAKLDRELATLRPSLDDFRTAPGGASHE